MSELKTFCFTKYFTNKSSYRSLSNIKDNILNRNADVQKVIKNIFKSASSIKARLDKLSENQISNSLKPSILYLITMYKELSKDDFRIYFKGLRSEYHDNSNVNINDITNIIISILSKLIFNDFYGSPKNKKSLMNLVRVALKGMLNQCLTKEKIIYNWDLDKVPWLHSIKDDAVKRDILFIVITWLLKNTMCSIIAIRFYVTTTSMTHETRKLYYFFKEDWQSLTDSIVMNLVHDGHIIKCNNFSLGTKSKKHLSVTHKRERKFFLKQIPVARFLLKSNNSVRIIIRYKKVFSFERAALKNRRSMFKHLFPRLKSLSFINKYLELFNKWKTFCEPKLYFVKTDLTDAFGKVDISELQTYLSQAHLELQKRETNVKLKCFVAKEFQKFYAEFKQPIYIRIGSCVYQWKRGLVQGMRFSPVLCEIYYSHFDEKCFTELQTTSDNEISYFMRYVDDYLFITDNLNKAIKFLEVFVSTGRINPSKTQCNFSWNDSEVISKLSFCGFVIDTHNLEIMRDETVYSKQIRYRMTINEKIAEPLAFIEKRITQTTIPLTPLYFNPKVNSEKTIWNNIFITLCISANKFCSMILLIFCENSNSFIIDDIINVYKRKVAVKMCDIIIKMISFDNNHANEMFCVNHIRCLAYKCLLLFANQTHLCSLLTPAITVLMKKSNCGYGKWTDHSSRLDGTGKSLLMASKSICRRKTLLHILQSFTTIPKNFEPFIKY